MAEDDAAPLAQQFGWLEAFVPSKETIHNYLEHAQLFFAANNIAERRQAAVLLTSIGPETYETLKNLLAPASLATKTLEELSTALKDHYAPTPSVIAERFYFHRRRQEAGESVSEFSATLRKLAIHCKYGEHLNEALRDQFVSGLGSEAMHKRLLSEALMQSAQTIAIGMEAAAKNAKDFLKEEAILFFLQTDSH